MKRKNKSIWQTIAFAVIATFVVFSASTSTFAQDDEKYPMPDFSPMNKWYEIKKAEYDLYASPPVMNLLIVIKKESRPYLFDMRFEDADGSLLKINTGFCAYYLQPGAELNTPIKCSIWIADRKEMKSVKTVRIVQKDK